MSNNSSPAEDHAADRLAALLAHPDLPALLEEPADDLPAARSPGAGVAFGLALVGAALLMALGIVPSISSGFVVGPIILGLIGVSTLARALKRGRDGPPELLSYPAVVLTVRSKKVRGGLRVRYTRRRWYATLLDEDGGQEELRCLLEVWRALKGGEAGVARLREGRLLRLDELDA